MYCDDANRRDPARAWAPSAGRWSLTLLKRLLFGPGYEAVC